MQPASVNLSSSITAKSLPSSWPMLASLIQQHKLASKTTYSTGRALLSVRKFNNNGASHVKGACLQDRASPGTRDHHCSPHAHCSSRYARPLSFATPKPPRPLSRSQRITPRVPAPRSYTTAPKTSPPLKKFHVPSTLAPARLRPTDFIDLSSAPAAPCEFAIRVRSGGELSHPVPLRYAYTRPAGAAHTPFPPATRGFLYYHTPTNGAYRSIHPAAGALRFRLTSSDEAPSFAAGTDLLRADGLPWAVPLLCLWDPAHWTAYAPLRDLLLADGLVTRRLWERCARMVARVAGAEVVADGARGLPSVRKAAAGVKGHTVRAESQVVHSFGQPFSVDFSAPEVRLFLLHKHGRLDFLRLRRPFSVGRRMSGELSFVQPFTGSAHCWFEPSPADSHFSVVMRIARITTPVAVAAAHPAPPVAGHVPPPTERWLLPSYGAMGLVPARTDAPADPGARDVLERGVRAWQADTRKLDYAALQAMF